MIMMIAPLMRDYIRGEKANKRGWLKKHLGDEGKALGKGGRHKEVREYTQREGSVSK